MADKPQDQKTPAQTGAQPDASRFAYAVASRYQHIVAVEGSHHDFRESGKAVTANPTFYDGLEKAGVKHNLMEVPQNEQELFHAYYNRDPEFFGVETRSQVKPEMVASRMTGKSQVRPDDLTGDHDRKMQFAKQIDLSRDHHMQPWAMDRKEDTPSTFPKHLDSEGLAFREKLHAQGVTDGQVSAWLQEEYKLEPKHTEKMAANGDYIYLVTETHNAPDFEKKFGVAEGTLDKHVQNAHEGAKIDATQERFKVDEQIWAPYIKDHVPEGEKTFSSGLGSSHASDEHNGNGVDEILGGDKKVATLFIGSNDKQIADAWKSKDPPHAVIDTRDNVVTVGEKLDLPGYKAGDQFKIDEYKDRPAAAPAPQPEVKTAADPAPPAQP